MTRSGLVLALVVVWFVLAAIAGISGQVASLHPPVPQLILVGLTAALIIMERRTSWLRDWVAGVSVRGLVALHLTRLVVGVVFLILARRGDLAAAFGVPAGWGDIGVAVLAGLLLAGGPPLGGRRTLYRVWNGLGLLDLAFVVVTAARLAHADPGSMRPLLQWPLGLVPTLLVPWLIASHVWLFRRLVPSTEVQP
jgi:hypothetical protein